MITADFWTIIDQQLTWLTRARTADDVLRILATKLNPYNDPHITSAPGFFAGSGGDRTVQESLTDAGWRVTWAESSIYYTMTAPDGSAITYIEGDIYREEK